MNLDQARNVLWLKSNPRPLGELLDEGYLTKERLEWAAKWAYNNRLKEAAQVLLDAMNTPEKEAKVEQKAPEPTVAKSIPLGITLDNARSTPWPFPPYKGQPMGALIESKQLSLKDLGYAIENAWDEKVRQAAIALSLTRLDQVINEPAPSAGYVHVISGGRSFSERRESVLTLIYGAILGFPLGLLVMWFLTLLSRDRASNPNAPTITEIISTPAGIVVLIIFVVIMIAGGAFISFVMDQISKRINKQIENHRLGQEGEDKTVQLMVQALDGNWHIYRNISLPGRNNADLDLVLVGPPGVWVFEVKNFRGKYRNIGESWYFQQAGKWRSLSKNPSRQSRYNSLHLKNFLKADYLDVFVNPVVVWANQQTPLYVENPSVAVWRFDRIPDELGNVWQTERLSISERSAICDKLRKLSERQKNDDARRSRHL